MQKIQTYNSPLGNLTLVSNGIALTGIWFEKQKPLQHILNLPHKVCNLPIFDDTKRWLDIYFEGDVTNFTPLLCPEGTHFRQQVWNYLLQIPYGKTTTYGALAKKMALHLQKQKMSAQAIGGAVGHNPIPIIIPCHRVIGTNGTMTGYASGIWRKEFLLELESKK